MTARSQEYRELSSIRIAIAGLGAIGRKVARELADGIPGLVLSAIATGDRAKAQAWLDREGIACPVVSLDELPAHADLALECAPAAILGDICLPMLNAGKRVMVLSASALLPRPDLADVARAKGGQIIVPTGALLGLDAVSAAAEGRIESVQMITRKPPNGLAGAPYLIGIPGQCECRAGAVAGGHRTRPYRDRNLGRSGRLAKLPRDPRRVRLGAFHDVDRKRSVRKSQDRPDYGAVGDRCAAQADDAVADRDLITPKLWRRPCC